MILTRPRLCYFNFMKIKISITSINNCRCSYSDMDWVAPRLSPNPRPRPAGDSDANFVAAPAANFRCRGRFHRRNGRADSPVKAAAATRAQPAGHWQMSFVRLGIIRVTGGHGRHDSLGPGPTARRPCAGIIVIRVLMSLSLPHSESEHGGSRTVTSL